MNLREYHSVIQFHISDLVNRKDVRELGLVGLVHFCYQSAILVGLFLMHIARKQRPVLFSGYC